MSTQPALPLNEDVQSVADRLCAVLVCHARGRRNAMTRAELCRWCSCRDRTLRRAKALLVRNGHPVGARTGRGCYNTARSDMLPPTRTPGVAHNPRHRGAIISRFGAAWCAELSPRVRRTPAQQSSLWARPWEEAWALARQLCPGSSPAQARLGQPGRQEKRVRFPQANRARNRPGWMSLTRDGDKQRRLRSGKAGPTVSATETGRGDVRWRAA